jgi:hypothetical protein
LTPVLEAVAQESVAHAFIGELRKHPAVPPPNPKEESSQSNPNRFHCHQITGRAEPASKPDYVRGAPSLHKPINKFRHPSHGN